MPPKDVYSAEHFWQGYSARAQGSLTESVLLAGRQDEAQTVRDRLGSIPSRIVPLADSRDEALGFRDRSIANQRSRSPPSSLRVVA
jgi:hypothetical protein